MLDVLPFVMKLFGCIGFLSILIPPLVYLLQNKKVNSNDFGVSIFLPVVIGYILFFGSLFYVYKSNEQMLHIWIQYLLFASFFVSMTVLVTVINRIHFVSN